MNSRLNFYPLRGQNFIATAIDEEFNISVISQIEILGHHSATSEGEKFVGLANVLDLNHAVASLSIELRKQHKGKLPDIIIAATALVHGFTLITRNVADFQKIEGLKVINPWDLQ